MEQEHLADLDVIDAFILKYANRISVQQTADALGISCQEVSARYDNLYFIHVSCQTPIDKEYHKRCNKLLQNFPPVGLVEGKLHKKK